MKAEMTQTEATVIKGVHHGAFRCRDAEQTRWFYEDVLGLRLEGGVVIEHVPGTKQRDPYMHLFFRMANGEYIAFFDAPGSAGEDAFEPKHGFDVHWAFEVGSDEEMLAMRDRVRAHGVACHGPIDHGFVRSVYMYDPNGLQIEITTRDERHDETFEEEREGFARTLADWSERTRDAKHAKFGKEAVARRGKAERA
jgi:catechol 2,3-dioxygenase-like lactoylglutathione lyase family enzyme